jgi:hypothetical protein
LVASVHREAAKASLEIATMPDKLTVGELNRRLATALGVDLGADMSDWATRHTLTWGCYVPYRYNTSYTGGFTWNGRFWPSSNLGFTKNFNGGINEDLWLERVGKAYQADIEAHVAAWERDPPNYAESLCLMHEVENKLYQRGLAMCFADALYMQTIESHNSRGSTWSVCHASAYDRALAAYRALGGEEKRRL